MKASGEKGEEKEKEQMEMEEARMTTPVTTITFNKEEFSSGLKSVSFAKHGDRHEQAYHSLLQSDFSKNEEFWRHFVVPDKPIGSEEHRH